VIREDDTTLRTFEFLHATFGEYLAARFVWGRLMELRREDAARSRHKSTVDDAELYSVLSYRALTTSRPMLRFLTEFSTTSEQSGLFDLIVRLLAERDEPRSSRGRYAPVPLTDSERDARYSLNLVLLALVLRKHCDGAELRMTVEDWQRLTLFWKSRLPSSEWSSVVPMLAVEWESDENFVVGLTSRTQELRTALQPTYEPFVTLDAVALGLREMLEPVLADTSNLELAATLIKLMMTPVEESLPPLRDLARLDFFGLRFVRELYRRLGTGGDDAAMLDLLGTFVERLDVTDHPVELLDAWLRLHEGGFQFSKPRTYPDLAGLLRVQRPESLRPDLFKRATAAAADLGIAWPPTTTRAETARF
jgi:hypothetical protein